MERRWFWWGLIALVLGLACPAIALVSAAIVIDPLSALRGRADVLVVLGGETNDRIGEAVTLYGAGRAERILVSGAGDCVQNRARLIAGRVPPSAILVDCTSFSTWENAEHANAIFRRLNAQRVIIVTSWFHVPRAFTCFDQVSNGIEYFAAPVQESGETWSSYDGARRIASEYVKAAWYMARHGAVPVGLMRLRREARALSTPAV